MEKKRAFWLRKKISLVFFLLLGIACQGGIPEALASRAEIKNIEVKANEIELYANLSLSPSVYVLSPPPKLILTIENAVLAKGIKTKGQEPGLIKSWELNQLKLGQAPEEVLTVKFSAELTHNVTYQIQKTDFGCKIVLEELKTPEELPPVSQIEIPKELYPQLQQLVLSQEAPSPGKVIAPSAPEGERKIEEMPKQPTPTPEKEEIEMEKMFPATTLTKLSYQFQEGDFQLVLTGDGKFSRYEILKLTQPIRVVIDLYGIKSGLETNIFPVNHQIITQVRVGKHPDKTRVVIDLNAQFKDVRITSAKNTLLVRVVF